MTRLIDLTGSKINRLTVIERVANKGSEVAYLCKCDCGNSKVIRGQQIRESKTKSCGCLSVETAKKNNSRHGYSPYEKKTSIYNTWRTMKQRCTNPNNHKYPDYGGRGIKVCEKWSEDFVNFLNDMGEKPSIDHSIERIDVNGNYEPSNCKWATKEEQARNQRVNEKSLSGKRGVIRDKGKWRVSLRIGGALGKLIHLGYYDILEDAIKAREEAELKYWKESS